MPRRPADSTTTPDPLSRPGDARLRRRLTNRYSYALAQHERLHARLDATRAELDALHDDGPVAK